MNIPKHLKIGDTFEDGGRTFVVQEITAVGYISTAEPKAVEKALSKKVESERAAAEKVELERLAAEQVAREKEEAERLAAEQVVKDDEEAAASTEPKKGRPRKEKSDGND